MSSGGGTIDSKLLASSSTAPPSGAANAAASATVGTSSSCSAPPKDYFITKLIQSSALATHISNGIPSGSNYLYNKTFPEFASAATDCSSHINELFSTIFEFIGGEYSNKALINELLSDASAGDRIIEVIDRLLEDADLRIDAGMGVKKAKGSISLSTAVDKEVVLIKNSKDMRKPQLDFKVKVDNSRFTPFQPRLTTKPNSNNPLSRAHVPLELDNKDLVAPSYYFAHPYSHEITTLSFADVSAKSLASLPSLKPWLPSPDQPFEYIDDLDMLLAMVDALKMCEEIAIDLEHHSYRSFQGFTCLIQISSRYKDYIVDAIKLRHCISELNVITTNPKIVKVLHGAEGDIMWLQKDFGVYVVNCFDSYHAAKLLRYPALSLAHLLKIFCGVTTNKMYQLADWRQRPLSKQMIEYAKSDTHHLLYIYDHLRKEVLSAHGRDGLELVFDASKKICLKRYEKEYFNPLGYKKLLEPDMIRRYVPSLSRQRFSSIQDSILGKLYEWRDAASRQEDESIIFIMSNAEMLNIAYHLPTNVRDLEANCGPLTAYSKKNSDKILVIISDHVSFNPLGMSSTLLTSKQSSSINSSSSSSLSSRLHFQPCGFSTIAQLNPKIEVDFNSLMSKWDRGGSSSGTASGVGGRNSADMDTVYSIIRGPGDVAGRNSSIAKSANPLYSMREVEAEIHLHSKMMIDKLALYSNSAESNKKRLFSAVNDANGGDFNDDDVSSSDSSSDSSNGSGDSSSDDESDKLQAAVSPEDQMPLSLAESYHLSGDRRKKKFKQDAIHIINEANSGGSSSISTSSSVNNAPDDNLQSTSPRLMHPNASFDYSQLPAFASVGSLLPKATHHRDERERARAKYKGLEEEDLDRSLRGKAKKDEGASATKKKGGSNPYLQASGRK